MLNPMKTNEPIVNGLSVDVEDYFHVRNFAGTIAFEDWETMIETSSIGVARVLDLLDRHQTKATFFILGWVAAHHPELVRRIATAGHEIACHGYLHDPVADLKPEQFRADLAAAKELLEEIVGFPVVGYRAPSFSINETCLWALDILIEEGFRYDSSLFPGRTVPVGFCGADRRPVVIKRAGGELVEFPLTRLDVPGKSLPFAGGGYFRLYPYSLIRAGLRRINRRAPAVIFFHPWELVPEQPPGAAPRASRFKHYVNLAGFERKLDRLLTDFRFQPLRKMLR